MSYLNSIFNAITYAQSMRWIATGLLFLTAKLAQASDELTLYVHSNTPPFEWHDGNHESGFNPELAGLIADDLSWSLSLQRRALADVITTITDNQHNAIAFIADNGHSHPQLAYSQALIATTAAAYNLKGQMQISTLDDMVGQQVGVKKGSFVARYIRQHAPQIHLHYFESNTKAFEQLANGKLDFVVSEFYCSWRLLSLYNNIKTASDPLIYGNFYIVSNKANPHISTHVNTVLEQLSKSGKLDALTKRWVGFGREKIDLISVKRNLLYTGGILGLCSFIGLIITLIVSINLRHHKRRLLRELNERKAAEVKCYELSTLFQSVLNDLPHGILIWDHDGALLWSNQKFESQLAEQQLCLANGQSFELEKLYQQVTQGLLPPFIELHQAHRHWHIQTHFLRQNRTLAILENTTERTQLRIENDMATRLVALGEISAGIAHEINNPLGLINESMRFVVSYLSELNRVIPEIELQDPYWRLVGLPPYEAQNELNYQTESIEHSLAHMSHIVHDLKALSCPGASLHYSMVDLNAVIESALRMTNNQTKRHQLNWQASSAPLLVNGDEVQLRLVIINFIQNACQAIKNNQGQIDISLSRKRDKAIISVYDNGIGMSAQQIERIKEPFFTTRRNEGGTGLGLALCSRIINEHSCQWLITSQLGKGTQMTLSFPLVETPFSNPTSMELSPIAP